MEKHKLHLNRGMIQPITYMIKGTERDKLEGNVTL